MTLRIKIVSLLCFTRIGPAALLALLLPGATVLQAGDWPQWRGPNRDGVWNETDPAKTFPADGLKIRWRKPVGEGWEVRAKVASSS